MKTGLRITVAPGLAGFVVAGRLRASARVLDPAAQRASAFDIGRAEVTEVELLHAPTAHAAREPWLTTVR